MSTEHEAITIVPDTNASVPHAHTIFIQTPSQNILALRDIREGLSRWSTWLMLAYCDITMRYRRSVLGPFWITLSMAITVYSMGYLYSRLFHIELQVYYPLLVSGMLTWSLIASIVTETTEGFITASSLINQLKLPYTLHIHRIVTRNIIIFFHNTLVMIPVLLLFHEYASINLNTLLLLPGLAILYVNSVIYGLILAMLGGRYRDITQVIKSLVQVVFFVTPVMWSADILPAKERIFVELNPFYAFLEVVRQPLLGRLPTLGNVGMTLIVTLLGAAVSFKMFARYRARIVYWL